MFCVFAATMLATIGLADVFPGVRRADVMKWLGEASLGLRQGNPFIKTEDLASPLILSVATRRTTRKRTQKQEEIL